MPKNYAKPPGLLRCTLLLLLGIIPITLPAQDFENDRPTVEAVPLLERPQIDGEVINDPIWQAISPFGDLIQTQPNFGAAASEKTEIRIAYTAETFYLSVVCYDAAPDQ